MKCKTRAGHDAEVLSTFGSSKEATAGYNVQVWSENCKGSGVWCYTPTGLFVGREYEKSNPDHLVLPSAGSGIPVEKLAGTWMVGESTASGGIKHDAGKPPMSLLPFDALVEVAKVLQFGAQKYAPGNWSKGLAHARLSDAALRHIGDYVEGRDLDPESKLEHLAHAACDLLFLIWMRKHRPDLDDRWCHARTEVKP